MGRRGKNTQRLGRSRAQGAELIEQVCRGGNRGHVRVNNAHAQRELGVQSIRGRDDVQLHTKKSDVRAKPVRELQCHVHRNYPPIAAAGRQRRVGRREVYSDDESGSETDLDEGMPSVAHPDLPELRPDSLSSIDLLADQLLKAGIEEISTLHTVIDAIYNACTACIGEDLTVGDILAWVSARVRGEDIYSRATNYHWKRRFEGGVPTPSEKESQWLSLLSLGLACETERKLKGNPLYERLTTATLGMHGPTACLEALQQCGYQVSTTHCCLADAKRVFAFQMLHVATITSKDRGPPQDRLNPKAGQTTKKRACATVEIQYYHQVQTNGIQGTLLAASVDQFHDAVSVGRHRLYTDLNTAEKAWWDRHPESEKAALVQNGYEINAEVSNEDVHQVVLKTMQLAPKAKWLALTHAYRTPSPKPDIDELLKADVQDVAEACAAVRQQHITHKGHLRIPLVTPLKLPNKLDTPQSSGGSPAALPQLPRISRTGLMQLCNDLPISPPPRQVMCRPPQVELGKGSVHQSQHSQEKQSRFAIVTPDSLHQDQDPGKTSVTATAPATPPRSKPVTQPSPEAIITRVARQVPGTHLNGPHTEAADDAPGGTINIPRLFPEMVPPAPREMLKRLLNSLSQELADPYQVMAATAEHFYHRGVDTSADPFALAFSQNRFLANTLENYENILLTLRRGAPLEHGLINNFRTAYNISCAHQAVVGHTLAAMVESLGTVASGGPEMLSTPSASAADTGPPTSNPGPPEQQPSRPEDPPQGTQPASSIAGAAAALHMLKHGNEGGMTSGTPNQAVGVDRDQGEHGEDEAGVPTTCSDSATNSDLQEQVSGSEKAQGTANGLDAPTTQPVVRRGTSGGPHGSQTIASPGRGGHEDTGCTITRGSAAIQRPNAPQLQSHNKGADPPNGGKKKRTRRNLDSVDTEIIQQSRPKRKVKQPGALQQFVCI